MNGEVNRRQLIIGVPAVVAASTFLPRSVRADVVSTAVGILVPLLAEFLFSELFAYIDESFKEEEFAPGAIVPPEKFPTARTRSIDSGLKTSFADAGGSVHFESPIFVMDKGSQSPMQLGSKKSNWSLVSGGKGGHETFRVHHSWLRWWMDKDNCGRIIASDTTHGECPHEGCNIRLASMRFIRGRETELLAVVPPKIRETEDYKRHREHAPPATDCPDFDFDTGAMDCLETTAK